MSNTDYGTDIIEAIGWNLQIVVTRKILLSII